MRTSDSIEAGDRPALEITESDIARGAELLRRWALADPLPISENSLREFVAELVATVCPQIESTALRPFLGHDRSLYREPEL